MLFIVRSEGFEFSRVESECSGEREVGSEGSVRVVPTIHCCCENSLLISFREGQRIFMCVCVVLVLAASLEEEVNEKKCVCERET